MLSTSLRSNTHDPDFATVVPVRMPSNNRQALVFFRVSDYDSITSSDTIGEAAVRVDELLASAEAGTPITTAVLNQSGAPVKEGCVFIINPILDKVRDVAANSPSRPSSSPKPHSLLVSTFLVV